MMIQLVVVILKLKIELCLRNDKNKFNNDFFFFFLKKNDTKKESWPHLAK
jgi:hypothetical protein